MCEEIDARIGGAQPSTQAKNPSQRARAVAVTGRIGFILNAGYDCTSVSARSSETTGLLTLTSPAKFRRKTAIVRQEAIERSRGSWRVHA